MLSFKRIVWPPCTLLVTLGLAVALTGRAAGQASDEVAMAGGPARAAVEAGQIVRLAETGRFDELLLRLEADFGRRFQSDPATATLIADLRRRRENQAKDRARRDEAFQSKLAAMRQALADGDLDGALVLAIESHGLCDEPEALFAQPVLIDVVAGAKAQAEAAEKSHDWVESSSIYRLLNLLYEEQGGFEEPLERVSTHIQMLGLYAPAALEALYDARDRRLGREAEADLDTPPPSDDWTVRLKGVDRTMLDEAMRWAATRHVDRGGYGPMLLGSLARLRVLTETRGLEQAFPKMGDPVRLAAFRDHLDRARATVEAGEIDRIEAATVIDGLLAKSAATLELPEAVVLYEAGEGAMATLDDFSGIIWPEELESFSRSTRGAFFGVGVQISRRDGRLVVVSPLENTPAQRAGIKSQDILATVNGQSTEAWTLNRAVNEITGPEGSEVALGIERGADTLEFVLKRARIEIESIRGWEHRLRADGGGWDYWIDRDAGIGYVRLSQFIPQTASDLDAAVAQMQQDRPIRGLILDLRFNPGGRLDASIEVADRFIAEGPIVSTVDGDGTRTSTERARRFRTYEDFPLIVLVNQGSASASEIVAGAVQDYGRAMIVGTRSFGKGSVQDLFDLAGRRARLKLTRQYYVLPLGRIIHRKKNARRWGIEPDLIVDVSTEQVAESLQLRQDADILRDGEAGAGAGDEPVTADRILQSGADPQLDACLIILRARQLAERMAAAGAGGVDPQARLEK